MQRTLCQTFIGADVLLAPPLTALLHIYLGSFLFLGLWKISYQKFFCQFKLLNICSVQSFLSVHESVIEEMQLLCVLT